MRLNNQGAPPKSVPTLPLQLEREDTLTNYRMYYLTPENHIVNHLAFSGRDDLAALDKARSLSRDHAIEIWEAKRRVALVKKGDAALNDSDPRSL